MTKQRSPAEEIEAFLNFVDRCSREYTYAQDMVKEEDKRLQDLLHEMEFAADRAERNRVATKLQASRRERRANKDIVQRDELLVEFFKEPENRKVLNKLRQLLGRQRKEEEFLAGERVYKPRAGKSRDDLRR